MLASRLPLATGPGLLLALATFWFLWIAINLPLDVGERVTAREVDYTPRIVDSDISVKPPPPERLKPVLEEPPAVGLTIPIESRPTRPTRADPPIRGGTGTIGLPNPGRPTMGGGTDHGTEVIFRGKPDYPVSALHRGIEGRVIVQFSVLASGQVSDVVVLAANPPGVFDAAAIAAVRRWRYRPLVVDGSPVASAGLKAALVFELPRN